MPETETKPSLRDDLIVSHIDEDTGTHYRVQLPESGETFEFGTEEWFLLEQMSTVGDIDTIIGKFEQKFGRQASREQVESLFAMVSEWGLIKGSGSKPKKASAPGNRRPGQRRRGTSGHNTSG